MACLVSFESACVEISRLVKLSQIILWAPLPFQGEKCHDLMHGLLCCISSRQEREERTDLECAYSALTVDQWRSGFGERGNIFTFQYGVSIKSLCVFGLWRRKRPLCGLFSWRVGPGGVFSIH